MKSYSSGNKFVYISITLIIILINAFLISYHTEKKVNYVKNQCNAKLLTDENSRISTVNTESLIETHLYDLGKGEVSFSPFFFERNNQESITHKIIDGRVQIEITTPINQQLFEECRFNQPGAGFERVRSYFKGNFGIELTDQHIGDSYVINRISDIYSVDKQAKTTISTLYKDNEIAVKYSQPGYHLPRNLIIKKGSNTKIIQLGYDLSDYKITDLDGDNTPEILLCGKKCLPQPPLSCWSNKDAYKSDYSFFTVFDIEGNIKKIGRKKLVFSNYYGTQPKFLHFPADSLLFIGFFGKEEQNWENMIVVNLRNGRLKDLGITYEDITGFFEENNRPGFIRNIGGEQYEKIVLDEEYNAVVKYRKEYNQEFEAFYHNRITIKDVSYSVYSPPFTLVDDSGNIIFSDKEATAFKQKSDNTVMLFYPQSDSCNTVEFSLTYHLQKGFHSYLMAELVFLILLTSYLRWRKVPNPPRNYLKDTIYFGFIHHIRLFGHIKRQVEIPRNFFFNNREVIGFLKSISREYSEKNVRFFFPFEMRIYELEPDSELNIIQEIAHDLKNEILSLKLIMRKQNEIVENSLDNSFRKLKDIVNLSRSPNLEKSSVNAIVKSIALRMSGHPFYEKLQLNLSDDQQLNIDRNLLETALDNYISNAFDAINENGYIRVETITKSNLHNITIENTITELPEIEKLGILGYSTKVKGSGCGLVISRRIIEKFGGFVNMEINQEKMLFRIEISLTI